MVGNHTFSVPARGLALIGAVALALLGISVAQSALAPAARADGGEVVIFDSIPDTIPQNWASQGAQAYKMQEFGQRLQLGGTARQVASVTVGFSSWTCENWATSDPCSTTPGTSYELPVTINIYASGTDGTAGGLVATTTETIEVPFRPSPYGAPCSGTQLSLDGGATCTSGIAFTADFSFASRPTLPSDVIVAVVYNTQSVGPAPTGVKSPSNSFNVALEGVVSTGSVADSDSSVYVNSNNAKWYTADETGSGIDPSWVNTFHAGANWDPYAPIPIRINAVPPPAPDDPAPAPPILPTDPGTPPPAPSSEGANGDPIVPPTLPSAPPVAGGSVEVGYADGTFLPYEWVQFVFYSTPAFSGSLQANASGGLAGSIPVPASVPAGSHTIAATGATSGVVVTAAVSVTALAETGADPAQTWSVATLGTGFLLLGIVTVLLARRRRGLG